MSVKNFLNLTNGIEALERRPTAEGGQFDLAGFVRIQSTALEQKRWWFVINELDYNFLLHVVQGYRCVVWDYSNRKVESRAIYQGLPWIRYVLHRYYFKEKPKTALVRKCNVIEYFNDQWWRKDTDKDEAFRKLRYFRNFLNTSEFIICGGGGQTTHDGDPEYYNQLLLRMR